MDADVDDEELARLAELGDPDTPLPHDAVPWQPVQRGGAPLLPEWYMPPPAEGAPQLAGWRRAVAWIVVAAFLAVVASGLCSTYGELVVA